MFATNLGEPPRTCTLARPEHQSQFLATAVVSTNTLPTFLMEARRLYVLLHEELVNIIMSQGGLSEQLLRHLTSITGKEPHVVQVPSSSATMVPLNWQPLSLDSENAVQAIVSDNDGITSEGYLVGSNTLSSDF